jgi:hypothetical protein
MAPPQHQQGPLRLPNGCVVQGIDNFALQKDFLHQVDSIPA